MMRALTRHLALCALVAPLLLPTVPAAAQPTVPIKAAGKKGACVPSPTVLHAVARPVPGLSPTQVRNATEIINAAAKDHVPERGQTVAVMTAMQASSLGAPAGSQPGAPATLFGPSAQTPGATPASPATSAEGFYHALTQVQGWQNLPPSLAAHAAQHNLNPDVYARFWPKAVRVVSKLTSGSGLAGMQNLAARAQAVADCTAATVKGQFQLSGVTPYVGPFPPTVLDNRAQEYAQQGGNGWFEKCQRFVANLAGRPSSGYSTALDAWQTFEAHGVAHLVTSNDGVSPPVGAWLYYRDSTNPAGHVVTYLGGGQIASTDVFGQGRVGIGPASAITDGPWRMEYLGWAAPWGQE